MRNRPILPNWLQKKAGAVLAGIGLFLPINALAGGPPPLIIVQPLSQTVQVLGIANFSVTASSGTKMSFQWYKDGVLLPGATHASHTEFISLKFATLVSQLFLGIRLECAKCHHHPYERWGQADYTRGWMGLPLILHGEPIGYLALDSLTVGGFNEQDAALVQAFADEVSIAIENARLFHQVEQLAITDPLTGLNNRRYFFDAARRELDRARRYQSPLSVILLDIDHFKVVNDRYGHLAGDRVLVKVAQLCRERLREVDVLARYGGEEFIFLLPQTALDGAFLVAERLCNRIKEEKFDTGDQGIAEISVSLGVAELDEDCVDTQALIQRADRALYVAKDTGRAHVTRWQAGMGVSQSE